MIIIMNLAFISIGQAQLMVYSFGLMEGYNLLRFLTLKVTSNLFFFKQKANIYYKRVVEI